MNHQQYIISIGGKEIGLDINDIEHSLLSPKQWDKFCQFIDGQTMMDFKGISIVFTTDYERFISGRPVID